MSLENRLLLTAFTVMNTNDSGTGSLRDAVNQANTDGGADTITFDPTVFATPQTIMLTTGQILLNDAKGISITGPTAGVTINGGGVGRVFAVGVGNTMSASFTGLTITGGSSGKGGGVYGTPKSNVTLTNCTISGNKASDSGGGVYEANGSLTMINCTLSGNSSSFYGGAVEAFSSTATLINVTISGNSTGNAGGGVFSVRSDTILKNTIVAGNIRSGGIADDLVRTGPGNTFSGSNNLFGTGGSGGLVNGVNGNQVGVANPGLGSLANNGGPTQTIALLAGSPAIHAGLDGTGIPVTDQRGVLRVGGVDIGAYQVAFSGPLVVNTTDGGNLNVPGKLTLFEAVTLANYQAGADTITFDPTVFASPQTITLTAGQLDLTDSAATTITAPSVGVTISGNSASRVFQLDAHATASLTGLTITGGNSDYAGGGLFFDNYSTGTLTNCTVSGNASASVGGGISLLNSKLTLSNSTVNGNTGIVEGGGIGSVSSTLTMTNVTLSGNHTQSGVAGGLFCGGGFVSVTNVTISGNSGSGIYEVGRDSNLTLNNSIVAGNTTASGARDIILSSFSGMTPPPVSGSNNLIGTGGSGGLVNGVNGNQVGVANPGLGSLANNGGPTQTISLLDGSPAIHAGIDGPGIPTKDQRGVPRVGGVDIGAYQVAFSGPLVVNTTDGGNLNVPGKLTLFEAVTLANYQAGADTIAFDPALFATPQTITLTAGQLELTDSAATTITAPTAGLTISGNNASRVFQVDGGATADLNGLTITGGRSNKGGGVYVTSHATANLMNCVVSGNTSTLQGGGIEAGSYSQVTVVNSTVSGNTAVAGAGIFNNNGNLTLSNSTFSGNTATSLAGGIEIANGTLAMTNVTVSDNHSVRGGGGVVFVQGVLTLTNSTISGNATGGIGGGIYDIQNLAITLNNSIVAGNTNSGGASDIGVAPSGGLVNPVSGSNNLIGTGGSGGLVNGVNGNQVGVASPLLAALGNYGGPTQTIALLPGSPAIDAGKTSLAIGTTDQRGQLYVGTVDIGAFESHGFTLTPVAGSTPQTAFTTYSFANPLGVTVTANNPVEPVNGGLINFTVPLSGPSAILSSASSTIGGGQASVTATANTVPGGFSASASATEGTTATFSLNSITSLTLTGLGGTVTYIQGGSPLQVAPALTVNQNLGLNIASAAVVFTNVQVGDRFVFYNQFALQHTLTLSPDETTATLTITGVSSAANYQATLRTVMVYIVATIPGTSPRTATFTVNDVLTNTATGSQTINVTLADQASVLYGIETTPLVFTANVPGTPPQPISNTLSIYDADSNNLTSATVQITSGYQNDANGNDVLSFAKQNGISGQFNAATGTMMLSGSSSVSNYRTALRSVAFSASGAYISARPRTLTITAYDDSTPTPLASNVVTRNVDVVTNLVSPTLTGLNGTTAFVQLGSPVPIASTLGITDLNDLDIAGATVAFTNLQPGDRFNFYNMFALQHTLVYSPDETSATLTITGVSSVSNYQATLQSVIFWNVAGNPSFTTRTATFSVTDTANQSGSGVQNFRVVPVNQPPVLSGIEQTPLLSNPGLPPLPVTSTLSVTDPDGNNLTRATVQITSGYQNNSGGHDMLSFTNQSGISGTFDPATGTMALSGSSSLSNYRVALRSVTFNTSGSNVALGTRTLTFTGFDDTTPTPLASNQVTRNVLITTTNASPVISGLSLNSTYNQGRPPLLFASTLQITDADSSTMYGTTISFTNWQDGDRLDFYNQFALQHTFKEDLVAHTASLTITGPASIANYQTMLQSIGFYNVAGNPNLTPRNVSIVVNDGYSNSNTATGIIYVQPEL